MNITINDIELRHVEILNNNGTLIIRGCLAIKEHPDVVNNRLKWAFVVGEDTLLEHLQFMYDH